MAKLTLFLRSGGDTPAHDLTNVADLQHLLASKVLHAELRKRPLDGWDKEYGVLSHSGVRVTLMDGSRHLIHKGKGAGLSSQTVVTDARHMSPRWRATGETGEFAGEVSVSDFIGAGGKWYNVVANNCHIATDNMMSEMAPKKTRLNKRYSC